MWYARCPKIVSHVSQGVTCICYDTGMCHYFGYFFGVLMDFWVPFWAIPRFLGVIFFIKFDFLGIIQIFGC